MLLLSFSCRNCTGEEDRSKEVKLVCRSAACTRLELHAARLATSTKLRAEWDRRLEKNSAAADVLNSNRRLWLQAGGKEPDTFVSPTEASIDHCHKTFEVLQTMLQKYGPQGGLDSFVQDIEVAVKMMKVVSRTLSAVLPAIWAGLPCSCTNTVSFTPCFSQAGNPSGRTASPSRRKRSTTSWPGMLSSSFPLGRAMQRDAKLA
jgi:hypothetical protein